MELVSYHFLLKLYDTKLCENSPSSWVFRPGMETVFIEINAKYNQIYLFNEDYRLSCFI